MTLDVPHLRSCSATRLRKRGFSACPVRSQIGAGHALVETRAGSQILTEEVALHAFLGPPRNLEPTFEILARGYTPLDERVVFAGAVLTADSPYGEELVMSIPPVATLPMMPDASVVTFSLTVGASTRHRTYDQAAVRTPSTCPVGGFPLAGEFSYADGSTGSAVTTIPCPPAPIPTAAAPPAAALAAPAPAALAARTFSLDEAGSLHATSKHGFTLNEQGSASGTIRGTIYVHLTIVSTRRVTAEVNIYPRGGSISGVGTASYERGTTLATFSGSASITHGTGSYAHAHGSGLSFSGTIARSTDAVTVHVSGRVSD